MPRRSSRTTSHPKFDKGCRPEFPVSDSSSSTVTPIHAWFTQLLSQTCKHTNAPSGDDRLCLQSISPSLDFLRSLLTESAPSGEHVIDYSRIPRSHPQFMNDLLHFAFSQRPPEDLVHLMTTLSLCTCDKQDDFIRSRHEDKRVVTADPVDLLKLLCRTIFRTINGVYESDINMSELRKLQQRSCRKPKDAGYRSWVHFLLENEVPMVESMVTWYVVTNEVAALAFISTVESLAMMGRKVLGLSTDPDTYFRHCPIQITRLFDVVLSNTMLAVRDRQPLESYDVPIDGLLTSISRLIMAMSDLPSLSNAYVVAADEDIRAAICTIEDADFTFPGGLENHQSLRKGLREVMRAVVKLLEHRGLPFQPAPFSPTAEAGVVSSDRDTDRGPYSDLFFVIMWVRTQNTCMNAYCGRPPASCKPFSVCAGCHFFSYCSRECQREAWSENHKPICKDVGKLVACWGATFEEVCKNIRPGRDRGIFVGCSDFDEILQQVLAEKGVELSHGVEQLAEQMQSFQDHYQQWDSDSDTGGEDGESDYSDYGEGSGGESDDWNDDAVVEPLHTQ